MTDLLDRLERSIRKQGPIAWRKRRVELVLGNDREIGRADRTVEKRVGLTPAHVRRLREMAERLELEVVVLVVAGAGVRAGFADCHYIEAGAEIVTTDELPWHDGPPDVVHGLKEPSRYESQLPPPFLRIGALHVGDFDPASGLAHLLDCRAVSVFDGSHIGAGYRIPIRGRMSDFAGEIAAEWIVRHLEHREIRGEVVVVGGGRAGTAAARFLSRRADVDRVRLFDRAADAGRLEQIAVRFGSDPKVSVEGLRQVDDPSLLDAVANSVGVLFAVARPGRRAPVVARLETLQRVCLQNAIVVDISIDEGGAILDPGIRPSWSHEQTVPYLTQALEPRVYRAVANMPRAAPQSASRAHGDVILPYIATLLFLVAREGGADAVVERLRRFELDPKGEDPQTVDGGSVFDAMIQDLRNGMAFHSRRLDRRSEGGEPCSRRLVVEDFVPNRRGVLGHLFERGIPFEFSLRRLDGQGSPEAEEDAKRAFEKLPEPIRECLECAVDRGVEALVISHPEIDGTHARDAARALDVGLTEVINCMLLCLDESRFVAAICEGNRRLSLERIAQLLGGAEARMATAEEIHRVTRHPPGGIPVAQIFHLVDTVLVSEGVLDRPFVVGSAGSEYMGMKLQPSMLVELGGRVESIVAEQPERDGVGVPG